ncbi:SMS protein [Fictibacillus macauensis ZFHKF-1]|uniref:GTP cyclohydrolase 1 type 2 homolog n=1 Tax=Fictibacillus macauensis ZFHKF-1 TaxID=1196324 RepID=I8AM86_9BACL|nr:Nif3-like dinuclear metal center hexameric protein [Fictibacillus macauensis]EIT87067.1 SMS protein [Fictibacillus macauensis ZFHKF-1]
MNLQQFQQSISTLFPQQLLEDFTGDYGFTSKKNDCISTIGYCTNLSLEVMEQAAANNVDLLITHHDAWDFLYGLQEACVAKLEAYNISHFWIHGPLDMIEFGTCTSLMNELGLSVVRYSTYDDDTEFPGIGEFHLPVSFEQLAGKMSSTLAEPVRAWKNNEKQVKKVGILTGAGHASQHLKMAYEQGCDTYITGEVTLYTIQYAQFLGMNLLVGSHTFTEFFGVKSLCEQLENEHPALRFVPLKESHFELQNA